MPYIRVIDVLLEQGEETLAKIALIVKQARKQKFKVREYNRCRTCGRARGYLRKFEMCRICFRMLARAGRIPGITKASW